MSFWIRDASLKIGKKTYYLDGLDFSFEVPFEDSDETPVATVTVTNLSESTRASIKKKTNIVLNAGYKGDVGCILAGDVVGLKHKQSGTDWTTTITVQPDADNILGQKINKTYKKSTNAKAIVKDLLNILGVEVGKCELSVNKTYPRGRVCKGKLKQVLTEIVVSECKSRLLIRPTGQIYITKSGDGIKNGVVLDTSHGLLRNDEEQEVIAVEKKSTSTKSSSNKDDDDTISRSCLLNYQIAPAEIIKVKSDGLNGTFIVKSGTHKGDSSGDWKTEMELKPHSTSTSKTSASVSNKPTIKYGSRGSAVKTLQTKLGITADGVFGSETRSAVLEYQKSKGLSQDGIVGPETWASLLGG